MPNYLPLVSTDNNELYIDDITGGFPLAFMWSTNIHNPNMAALRISLKLWSRMFIVLRFVETLIRYAFDIRVELH